MDIIYSISVLVFLTLTFIIHRKIKYRNRKIIEYLANAKIYVRRLKRPVYTEKNIPCYYDYILKVRHKIFKFIPIWITEEHYQFAVPENSTLKEILDEFFTEWYSIQKPLEELEYYGREEIPEKDNIKETSEEIPAKRHKEKTNNV